MNRTETLATAAALRRQGLSLNAIAARLGLPKTTVQAMVESSEGRGAVRPRTAGGREAYLVRRGVIP